MKAPGLCCGCFLLLSISCLSGQSQAQPAPSDPAPVLTATNRLQRVFGPTAVYDGVLPEVKRRGGIASRVDFWEPVVPGREFRNVSVHPRTGQAQGVVLIAVRY